MSTSSSRTWQSCDRAIGGLLCLMIVISVWLFGSSPPVVVAAMNALGCTVGGMVLLKRLLPGHLDPTLHSGENPIARRLLSLCLGGLTVFLLAWCLISTLNVRAVVDLVGLRLVEKPDGIDWLPHSYDRPSSWRAFWQCLGLAGVFWGVRDWIVSGRGRGGESSGDWHETQKADSWQGEASLPPGKPFLLAPRIRLLTTIVACNGGALAVVGILSLVDPPSKVLWLLPHETRTRGFFGPFWYRNHAAAYLNLAWPFCLALAWECVSAHHRAGRRLAGLFNTPVPMLLGAAAVMVTSIIASGSRGGMLISLILFMCIVMALLFRLRRRAIHLVPVVVTAGILVAAVSWMTWDTIERRFFQDFFCYPTGVKTPLERFTLRCRLVVPERVDEDGDFLVGISEENLGLRWAPGSVGVFLLPKGSVGVRINGDSGRSKHMLSGEDPQLGQIGAVATIDLAFEPGRLGLSVNGKEVPLSYPKGGAELQIPARMRADFLWVGRERGDRLDKVFRGKIDFVGLETPDVAEPLSASAGVLGQAEDEMPEAGQTVSDGGRRLERCILEVRPRLFSPRQWFLSGLSGRERFYEAIKGMIPLYPAWSGSGPGTFAPLFKVYLQDPRWTDEWAAHDDFLEARLTYGWLGGGVILFGIILSVVGIAIPGRLVVPPYFVLICLLALGGALLHARFDWIFQNYALLLHGVVLCGVLASVVWRSVAAVAIE